MSDIAVVDKGSDVSIGQCQAYANTASHAAERAEQIENSMDEVLVNAQTATKLASSAATAAKTAADDANKAAVTIDTKADKVPGGYLSVEGITMILHGSVIIDCFGDSTTYGYNSVINGQVSEPAPAALQRVLRAYYNHTATITVNNKGVSGETTTERLTTFVADMAASIATIVFINYGLNDLVALTPAQFKANLTELVKIAQTAGKKVVLETSNFTLYNPANATNTGSGRMNINPLFAEITRIVAKEMNLMLVDNFKLTAGLLDGQTSDSYGLLADGVHPSQAMYSYKGTQMAKAVIPTPKIYGEQKLLGLSPYCIVQDVTQVGTYDEAATKIVTVASKFSFFFDVKCEGLDIYAALCLNQLLSPNVTIKVDGSLVNTISCVESSVPVGGHIMDHEILIVSNVSKGCHIIEIDGGSGAIECQYLRFKYTYESLIDEMLLSGTGSAPQGSGHKLLYPRLRMYSPTINEQISIFRDFPIPRTKPFEIIFDANLATFDGICLFTLPVKYANTTSVVAFLGVMLYLNTSGYPCFAEGSWGAFKQNTTIIATNYAGVKHNYRILYANNNFYLFIDGVQVGTAFTINSNCWGGFLGLHRNQQAGTIMEITNVSFSY